MTLTHNPAHVADGLAAPIHDLRKPRLQALLGSYLQEVQELEDAYWDLYLRTMIRDAAGQALERLGALVGQPRQNRTDSVYRIWILARALVLRSSGRPEELLRIARMVLPDSATIRLREEYPAAVSVLLDGPVDEELGRALASLLHRAKADGVRMLVRWTSALPAFRYSVTGGREPASASGYGAGGYASVSTGGA
jgi:hypothetical protein